MSIGYKNNPEPESKEYQSLLAFINKMHRLYKITSLKHCFGHYLTRRVESMATIMLVFGLMTELSNYFSEKGLNFQFTQMSWFSYSIFVFVAAYFLADASFEKIESSDEIKQAKKKYDSYRSFVDVAVKGWVIWLLTCLVFVDWAVLMMEFVCWGVLLFIIAYSSNRKYGYTRAFMRNDFYAVKVEVLKDALEHDLDSLDTIRTRLHDICIEAKLQAHKDTVGDYVEVNNAALTWLTNSKSKS